MNVGLRPAIKLRYYQQKSKDAAVAALVGGLRTLVVMPTGSGKTIVARAIVDEYLDQGKSVLWLAHRIELLNQARNTIGRSLSIQSVQGFKRDDDYDLIVTDEAHHATAPQYREIYAQYPNAHKLGLTATPERLDGTGLGAEFDVMVQEANVETLIADGHLADIRYFVPEFTIDTDGVASKRGDYDKTALSKRARSPMAIADAIGEYKTHAEGRRGIVFCLDRAHTQDVTAAYVVAGYRAVWVDGKLSKKERVKVFEDWAAGVIDIICNCELITEGLDIKDVDFVQVLRPTQSRSLYFQMVGRGMRPSRLTLHVLDHTTNWDDIGLPSQHHEYKLTDEVGKNSAIGNRTRMERSESGKLIDTGEKIEDYRSARLVALDAAERRSAEINAFIIANQDWTNARIARYFEVSGNHIEDLRLNLGLKSPHARTGTKKSAEIDAFITANQGWSNTLIAKHLEVGLWKIANRRKDLELKNPYSKTSAKRSSKIDAFIIKHQDWSAPRIARRFGVSAQTIWRRRKKLGGAA
jgi:DNA repair protein RadD